MFKLLLSLLLLPTLSFGASSTITGIGGGGGYSYSALIAGGSQTTDCTAGCTVYREGKNGEAFDWISSINHTSGEYQITFQTGTFPNGAICSGTVANTNIRYTQVVITGNDSVTFKAWNTSGSAADTAFTLKCEPSAP